MNSKHPKVDALLNKPKPWRAELSALRAVLLEAPVTEAFKWGKACYVFDDGNIAILQGFKHFCAVLFPKGALLKDPHGLLRKPGENTQSARRLEFTGIEQIESRGEAIRALVQQAIEVEKAGLKMDFKPADEFAVPEELQARLDADPALNEAFQALTPGRQRGYLLHVGGAKQSKTRAARVEKCIPRILDGLGLHDR